jgi:hypothetical protein
MASNGCEQCFYKCVEQGKHYCVLDNKPDTCEVPSDVTVDIMKMLLASKEHPEGYDNSNK